MKTKTVRPAVIRLGLGVLLHGTAYAGLSTQLYQPVPPLVVSDVQRPAQPSRRLVFTTPSRNARRLGTPRLYGYGEGVFSIDQ
jgi:hypothetical protein